MSRFRHNPSGNIQVAGRLLHHRIFEVFHGPIPADHEIDHIDSNHRNNFHGNLQALTRQQHGEKTNGKPVWANGVVYPSIKKAAETCGITAAMLARYLRLGKHQDKYRYAATKRKADDQSMFEDEAHVEEIVVPMVD